MKSAIIFALLAVVLIIGTITPVLAQTPNTSSDIVINEVELNPPGTDSRSSSAASSNVNEFIELYNPTDSTVDLSGWQIIPSKAWKTYIIPSGSMIQPNDHAVFMATSFWFNDSSEFVTLKNNDGVIIDQTPLLEDPHNDMNSWQRVYDGLDTGDISDWELKTATGSTSNGNYIPEIVEDELTVHLEIDKEQYDFGEKVNISGSVSSQSYDSEKYLMPTLVTIFVNGPGSYKDTITLYPDTNLEFSTSLNLHKVFGYSTGLYSITATYSTATTAINFTIGDVDEETVEAGVVSELTISSDKSEYEPGEWVNIKASTSNSINYVGLKYTISDSKGNTVSTGSIFPDSDNNFTTKYFIPISADVFGEYQLFASYQFTKQFSQSGDSQTAVGTFSVLEDIKEDKLISVWTDKEIYGLGETIHISGRSNSIHVDTFDITIQQTGIQTGFSGNDAASRGDPLSYTQSVRLDGNSSFELDLELPATDARLGDYKIIAGEKFGKGYGFFKVVEDPLTYVVSEITPLGLKTDRQTYELNDKMLITGLIDDFHLTEAQSITFQQVQITFKDQVGHNIKHEVKSSSSTDQYEEQLFLFTSIPDKVGYFRNQVTLDAVTFSPGTYTIKASYENKHDSIQFEILSDKAIALAEASDEIFEEPIILTVDKDVYEIGDTILVTGKVVQRELISARSEVSKMEEQGQDDHYRPKEGTHVDYTNYALNFVKIKIPHPIVLYSNSQSEYRTTTVDGSLPSGGCGPSGGTECQGAGSYDGIVKYNEIIKKLEPFESQVYPDGDGNFHAEYKIRGGVFEAGTYSVQAEYFGEKTELTIRVVDNRHQLGGEAGISVSTDKEQYKPGEIVEITGLISNVYYFDPIGIIVNPPDQSGVNCLKMYCGEGNVVKKVKIGGYYTDSPNVFGMQYSIPTADFALGEYTIIADTKFGKAESTFIVTENPILKSTSQPVEEKVKITKKIIDKVNRISNTSIPISVKENSGEDNSLIPRVVQGSLFTSARGEEPNVNLHVSTKNGSCIIGQGSDCVISESTRVPGSIYKVLKIDGVDYKVRYSGPDVRLEKFSIVPSEENIPLKILNWDINVIKDEQPSRFYYKVTYVPLE